MLSHTTTWVPASERLPEDSGTVLVVWTDGTVSENAWFNERGWMHKGRGFAVLAWCERPTCSVKQFQACIPMTEPANWLRRHEWVWRALVEKRSSLMPEPSLSAYEICQYLAGHLTEKTIREVLSDFVLSGFAIPIKPGRFMPTVYGIDEFPRVFIHGGEHVSS